MHACDRRTDRQTDRITTPKTALAYARAVKLAEWTLGRQLRICGGESPNQIVMQFCTGVDIRDIVTPANFGVHQLIRFRMAGSNFRFFHWLLTSSLLHSGTTVPSVWLCYLSATVYCQHVWRTVLPYIDRLRLCLSGCCEAFDINDDARCTCNR